MTGVELEVERPDGYYSGATLSMSFLMDANECSRSLMIIQPQCLFAF